MNVTVTLAVSQTSGFTPIPDFEQTAIVALGQANNIAIPTLYQKDAGTWQAAATVVSSDIGPAVGTVGHGASANSWQEAVAIAFSALGYA